MLKNEASSNRAMLLKHINEVSFAINDIVLYLDTHPYDQEALNYYRENMEHRQKFLKQYTELYGPLTLSSYADPEMKKWKWEEQPFPWEIEGGC